MARKKHTGGDCYMAAYRHIVDVGKYGQEQDALLCHGMVTGQGPLAGKRFSHAWVEVRDGQQVIVRDLSNGKDVTLPRDAYYRLGQVEASSVHRYTFEEALILSLRTQHFGPWDDALLTGTEESSCG